MTKQEAEKKINKVRAEIKKHDFRYYVEAKPVISDFEYDKLMSELVNLEKQFPELITPDSPTQRVSGQPLKEFATVTHKRPMLSLENTYSEKEVLEFDERVAKGLSAQKREYVVEPKIDGVAVSLVYEAGKFMLGSTRGDGIKGDDITSNLKTIRSIPLVIMDEKEFKANFGKFLEIRGEVYLAREVFLKINQEREEEGEQIFANPRNAAAGSLKLLDPRQVAQRPLDLFIHTVGEVDKKPWKSHAEALGELKKIGFKTIPFFEIFGSVEEVIKFINSWENKRDKLDFEIDGMVIKVNSFSQQESLAATGKSPRWAIAYKYPPRQATTVLEDILLQVGRTGTVTPVAVLKPVSLSGSVISRSTLHNFDEIERKDIRVGDTVVIEKGGEVIPQIVKVVEGKRTGKEKKFKIPDVCPVCSSHLNHPEGEVAYRCQNVACPAQVLGRIIHFTGRTAMNLENIGPALVDQLLKKGMIHDYSDLFFLKADELAELERMAEKSAGNVIKALEQSKNNSFSQLIYALGIRHCGIHAAEILSGNFNSLDELMAAKQDELEKISGIGPVVAASIADFFAEKHNIEVIEKLRKAGVNFKHQKGEAPVSQKLAGQTFVFTGEMSKYTRGQAGAIVKRYGGRESGTVSKKTSYVVAGENPGSKLDKAKKFDVKIINESEFEKLVRAD